MDESNGKEPIIFGGNSTGTNNLAADSRRIDLEQADDKSFHSIIIEDCKGQVRDLELRLEQEWHTQQALANHLTDANIQIENLKKELAEVQGSQFALSMVLEVNKTLVAQLERTHQSRKRILSAYNEVRLELDTAIAMLMIARENE